jgi:hypothetical protein
MPYCDISPQLTLNSQRENSNSFCFTTSLFTPSLQPTDTGSINIQPVKWILKLFDFVYLKCYLVYNFGSTTKCVPGVWKVRKGHWYLDSYLCKKVKGTEFTVTVSTRGGGVFFLILWDWKRLVGKHAVVGSFVSLNSTVDNTKAGWVILNVSSLPFVD